MLSGTRQGSKVSASTTGYPECNPPAATWTKRRKGGAFHQDNTVLEPRGFWRRLQDQVRINFTLTSIIC